MRAVLVLRSQDHRNQLEGHFRAHAQRGNVALGSASEYVQEYLVRSALRGPIRRTARIVSRWIFRRGGTVAGGF